MCFWLWIHMIIQVPFLCIQISEIDFRFTDNIVCIGKFNWLLLTPGNSIRKKWYVIYFEWEKSAKVISCTLASLFLYVKPLQSQAHEYMFFFWKKMFIFMAFFHWYGFGMVPGLYLGIYFSQKCTREAHFWLK